VRGWRLLVAAFTLIAFALQSYLTETHIHIAQATSFASITAKPAESNATHKTATPLRGAPSDKAPSNEEPVKCPLCQAVGYAGHFVAPSSPAALLLTSVAISILPLALAVRSPRESPSHIWQGRGPPNS
jgi:hypothetical protein